MDKREAGRATLYIMAVFFLQPMAFGAWLAMIPYVKDALDLSKAELAWALMGMPVALTAIMPLASKFVDRVGPRSAFRRLFPVQAIAILLPLFAVSGVTLFAALALVGIIVAFMEVALNTYAGRLEKASGRLIMSRCHGFWALGVGVGSFLAASLAGFTPLVAVGVVAMASTVLGIISASRLVKLGSAQEDGPATRQTLREMPRVLFLIAGFVFAITLVEGAMSDWAAVYLAERWGGPVTEAGIAVSVFAGFLACGRFVGDWLIGRFGATGAARLTLFLAMAGLICLTVPQSTIFLFIGFALVGLGVSVGFPLGISAAAALDDRHEAQNIATTSMFGISAFLFGPPSIGLIAEAISLRVAFMMLIPGLVTAFFLARILSIHRNRG